MFKSSLNILKQIRLCKYRYDSSISNKEYFKHLAEHTLKIQELKAPVDNLKFLRDNDAGNLEKEDSINKVNIHDSDKIKQNDKSLLYFGDIDGDDEVEIDKTNSLFKDVQILKDFNNNSYQYKDDVTSDELQKQIETINLDDLNFTPIEITQSSHVNIESSTLVKLLKFGVDLQEVSNRNSTNILMNLDWEIDIMPVLSYFKDICNFTDKELANILSNYPKIVKRPLNEVGDVIKYLNGRQIMPVDVSSMILKRPHLLHFKADHISKRLTEIEDLIKLNVYDMNRIIVAQPDTLTGNLSNLKSCIGYFTNSVGFSHQEMKAMIVSAPEILLTKLSVISKNFIFLIRSMKLSHEEIVDCAPALASNPSALSKRIKYLIFLKRYQPDPAKALYISLADIAKATNKEFCERLAESSLRKYNEYLKNLGNV